MSVVKGNKIGANKTTLLIMYKALFRSKIDYGCQVYNSASDNALKTLDIIQLKAIKIAISAFRQTPSISVLAESRELPLQLRRDQLTLRYSARTQILPGLEFPVNRIIEEIRDKFYRVKIKQHSKTSLQLFNT